MSDWPKLDLRLGQVVAVSIGVDGHPVIFHRADRIWTDEYVEIYFRLNDTKTKS